MTKLRVAVATDDGIHLMDRHFGDAELYALYDVELSGFESVGQVTNRTEEEEGHADPKKAKGIAQLLGRQGVQVVVARVFGPNIKRIRKRFVCVLTRESTASASLEQLKAHFDKAEEEWHKGEAREILDLRR